MQKLNFFRLLFLALALVLAFGSYFIFAEASGSLQNKKEFYSWLKQLNKTKYTYMVTLDQKEYLTTETAYLTYKVQKGKYQVDNIPFKVLVVDANDHFQDRNYQIVKHSNDSTNHRSQASFQLRSSQETNLFKTTAIHRDKDLIFNVGSKAGVFHLYTLFLHPTQHYVQHINKQTYRVLNKFYFYSSLVIPYFFIILLLGLSFFTPLKSLKKSPYFFIFTFLTHKFYPSSLLPLVLGLFCFGLASVFYSTFFLLALFFLILIMSYFYQPLQEILLSLLLLMVFIFFWETYGDTVFFGEWISTNLFYWIGINLLLLLLSPLLTSTLLLLLMLHFPLLSSNYSITIIGNVAIVCLGQLILFRKFLFSAKASPKGSKE